MNSRSSILSVRETHWQRHLRRLQTSVDLDSFYQEWSALITATLPHHSIKIEFNDLEVFEPRRVRDSEIMNQDPAYLVARSNADICSDFLKSHSGLEWCLSQDIFRQVNPTHLAEWNHRFMIREGWDKFITLNFWKGQQRIAGLTVRRACNQPDFSRTEQVFVRSLHGLIHEAVERLYAFHGEKQARGCLQNLFRSLPLPVLILDWNLQPVLINLEGRRACAEWILGSAKARAMTLHLFEEVPSEVLQACRRLKVSFISDARSDGEAQTSHAVIHPTMTGLEATIELAETREDIISQPSFVIRFRHHRNSFSALSSSLDETSQRFVELCLLTPAERQIVELVKLGRANEEIAGDLSKTVHTVKAQLKSIFRKLNCSNRTQLAARFWS